MNTKIRDTITNKSHQSPKPWWNRPLIGQKSLLERVNNWWQEKFILEEVPENSLDIYKNALKKIRDITNIAKAIDNAKFSNREFINFVKIN
jgi:hypothetical protein